MNDKCWVLIMHQLIHVDYLILKDFDDELYKIVYDLIEHLIVNRKYSKIKTSNLILYICIFSLSISTLEEHKSTTTTPAPKRTKLPDKECGIQCDVSLNKNII